MQAENYLPINILEIPVSFILKEVFFLQRRDNNPGKLALAGRHDSGCQPVDVTNMRQAVIVRSY